MITFEQLPQKVSQLCESNEQIKNELTEIKKNLQPKEPTEYLTRKEVAVLLKCDLSTVHNWTKSGKLKAYYLGDRVYYKRFEIDSAMVLILKKVGKLC